ncbi:MAG TPA: hypothetical protein VH701_17530 [Vicinamibacterales bacterium]
MLLKQRILEGLGDGTITLAFRRWDKPRVRAGSRFLTAVGAVAIDEVEQIDRDDISDRDARRAGFPSVAELFQELDRFGPGPVYRISLRLAGPDPRVELRRQDRLTPSELADVSKRLSRLDAGSRRGPWTLETLRLIKANPGVRAADLARSTSLETLGFKRDVRRLKALGLTESLEVGYQISARGRAVLRGLRARDSRLKPKP